MLECTLQGVNVRVGAFAKWPAHPSWSNQRGFNACMLVCQTQQKRKEVPMGAWDTRISNSHGEMDRWVEP